MLKEQESVSKHSQAIPYFTQLYTALARASLTVFLATLGHIPPCPKESTLQKEDPYSAPTQGQKNEKY